MMNSYNKGFCFNCGEPVDLNNWELIDDHSKVWICDKSECHRQLRREQRRAEEENNQDPYEWY